MRGALDLLAGNGFETGIIPACAGSTGLHDTKRTDRRDHPRMCGEHAEDSARVELQWGSSPHVRGAPLRNSLKCFIVGIIPACAGSTEPGGLLCVLRGDHPRMCGEHMTSFVFVPSK